VGSIIDTNVAPPEPRRVEPHNRLLYCRFIDGCLSDAAPPITETQANNSRWFAACGSQLSSVPLGVRVLDRQTVLRPTQSQIEFPRTTVSGTRFRFEVARTTWRPDHRRLELLARWLRPTVAIDCSRRRGLIQDTRCRHLAEGAQARRIIPLHLGRHCALSSDIGKVWTRVHPSLHDGGALPSSPVQWLRVSCQLNAEQPNFRMAVIRPQYEIFAVCRVSIGRRLLKGALALTIGER
jgi:hypothetical protein